MTVNIPFATYSARAVWLHWLTAGLVVLQWFLGRYLDVFPPPIVRMQARSTHMVIGLVVLIMIAERVMRRFSHPVAHPAASPRWANLAAAAMHWALYGMVIAVILVGVGTEWMRGDPIFGLFKIPPFDPTDRHLRRVWGDFHGLLGNCLLGLAFAHATAAILHEKMCKDGVLGRMIPAMRGP